jgi:hypothetical protein
VIETKFPKGVGIALKKMKTIGKNRLDFKIDLPSRGW